MHRESSVTEAERQDYLLNAHYHAAVYRAAQRLHARDGGDVKDYIERAIIRLRKEPWLGDTHDAKE